LVKVLSNVRMHEAEEASRGDIMSSKGNSGYVRMPDNYKTVAGVRRGEMKKKEPASLSGEGSRTCPKSEGKGDWF